MKTAPIFLCAAAFILASVSCDKHSFEETKVLHEKYQKHGEGHGDFHADPHAKEEKHEAKKEH